MAKKKVMKSTKIHVHVEAAKSINNVVVSSLKARIYGLF
jgi:hypothetical protein